ncbi:hypothetical protein HELRODRAFT_178991 [Helobdella robusta]|uniref:Uncharacterized protein n=1 Tax=Helobdella robusta TaxID=6412 RepID=T1FE07_HELRO|nr:hypothetical protein HELRODRAFT_178991 [Helobdella robusta]ESN95808.1 hypothetical protein HELRODRAFT_178991 [Helobdella robusta]
MEGHNGGRKEENENEYCEEIVKWKFGPASLERLHNMSLKGGRPPLEILPIKVRHAHHCHVILRKMDSANCTLQRKHVIVDVSDDVALRDIFRQVGGGVVSE